MLEFKYIPLVATASSTGVRWCYATGLQAWRLAVPAAKHTQLRAPGGCRTTHTLQHYRAQTMYKNGSEIGAQPFKLSNLLYYCCIIEHGRL